ncbi:MAG: ABC transporter permease, partial [Lachnospiraceae bacterium]|nr:ABC transporter permease [Lachnospiraceae bacterium]
FPIEKQMIVKETLNMEKIESLGTWTVIMNTDVYTHLFGGKILGMVLVKCADPDAVKERIEKCSESTALSVETLAEKTAMDKDSTSGLLLVIRLIVAGSAGLTLIGIAGNQSLGFLTRKRENALLYSVALPRGGLKKMLFLESVFSMGISAVIAAITAPFLYGVLGHLLDVIGDGDINILEQGMAATTKGLLYLGVILVVYLMTTLIPFKYLRKMNIAEELKYE